VSTAFAVRPELDTADEPAPRGNPRLRWLTTAAIAAVVLVGSALRFVSVPPLWLDEAQGLMIARMPIPELFQGLREDGAPPLYYLLLQAWTAAFGVSDQAARSLSGVISVATLPIFWLAGRRLGGSSRIGYLTLVLAAANPWLIRYGSEARMYSLVILFSLLVVLATHRVWNQPTITSGVMLAVAGAGLLYTHYWALFLLAAVGVMAIVEFVQKDRRAALVSIAGLAGAGVLFLPWLPSFVFQSLHTGTPWANRPNPTVFLGLLQEWSAHGFRAAAWTAFVLWPLLIFGYGAVNKAAHRIEIDLRGNSDTRWLAWLGGLTLLIAYVACTIQTSAYVARYTSVVIGLVFVLAAIGLARLPTPYTVVLTVVLAAFWLAGSAFNATQVVPSRSSQAGQIAKVLNAEAAAGDLIVFCPDQLGPSVSRLLRTPAERIAFPAGRGVDPARVNWVDYKQRHQNASASDFARSLDADLPATSSIWLVSFSGYLTYGESCTEMQDTFDELRGEGRELIEPSNSFYERAGLNRW